jgi:diphosphomevalonate decarboxylase
LTEPASIRQTFARCILGDRTLAQVRPAKAFAPANIALVKYWGKRDEHLNLPRTSSLSVSLGTLGTHTALTPIADEDEIRLDNARIEPADPFAARIRAFLDVFRDPDGPHFRVDTRNTIPTAAGLASSASGFAALTLALNHAAGWDLDARSLSMLARLGSGSACRSLYPGFVEWQAGNRDDGTDSYARPLDVEWPTFRIATLTVSDQPKPVGSRPAMAHTIATSALYQTWPAQADADLQAARIALRTSDFALLGQTAESNALAMHATMIAARPPVLYWLPESVARMQQVWALRRTLPLYFTMDAGPNLKLLFLAHDEPAVRAHFPDARVIAPFSHASRLECPPQPGDPPCAPESRYPPSS